MLNQKFVAFLADLEKNNEKAWFEAHKSRYEEVVLEPARALIREMAPRLAKVSKHFVVDDRKSGGSLSRIYRDVRFSKDKRPYNTHVTMIFHHDAGKKIVAPGYYLRLSAEGARVGAGIWKPDATNANRIREAIVEDSRGWQAAVGGAAFKKQWAGLEGESLKRPPRGFDAEHPFIEDLKRKDFVAFADFSKTAMVRKDLIDKVEERYQSSAKLVRFICQALDLPF